MEKLLEWFMVAVVIAGFTLALTIVRDCDAAVKYLF